MGMTGAADKSLRRRWMVAALLAGGTYLLIGRVFARPTAHVQEWRVAAWLVSGIVFALHFLYERFRMNHRPSLTAFHTALGAALGALGLAVAGMLHDLSLTSA